MHTKAPRRIPKTKQARSEHLVPGFSTHQIDSRLPKTAQVYELLRAAIISMKLPPATPIVEKEVCEMLGISRTPLREAIIQLATESLILVKPGGGTFINRIVLTEVLEGQIIRDTLEARLVRLAARHFTPFFASSFEVALFQQKGAADRKDMDEFFELDNKFHKLVCECSGFSSAWQTLHSATGQLDRVRRYALPKAKHFRENLQEHASIYQHIKDRNEDGAADAFQHHIDRLFKEIDFIRELDPELVSYDADVSVLNIR